MTRYQRKRSKRLWRAYCRRAHRPRFREHYRVEHLDLGQGCLHVDGCGGPDLCRRQFPW